MLNITLYITLYINIISCNINNIGQVSPLRGKEWLKVAGRVEAKEKRSEREKERVRVPFFPPISLDRVTGTAGYLSVVATTFLSQLTRQFLTVAVNTRRRGFFPRNTPRGIRDPTWNPLPRFPPTTLM